jgi:hypothetical protein
MAWNTRTDQFKLAVQSKYNLRATTIIGQMSEIKAATEIGN